ncbi:chromosomal replication initiator protein DnaA [Anaerobaca lacustris]|uniref:Chromosomal replication initiator protein DnaA n=1 Tax=Anaerobaca lacustris TaxID=3044600 RepID=A0AAW6U547_9BACT|nr:chromosomal replication initiator protein DnaA [Sedimentisphaerales bacterium M17dextr]
MSAHEVANIFTDIVARVRAMDPANARTWFDDLTVERFDGGSIAIGCPDESNVRFLHENCRSSFTRAAQQITGHLVTVDFVVGAADRRVADQAEWSRPALHPDYTFENFVVGPSNRLAHASCIAVGQSLGQTYNPLFLYGSAGLGKTHLLHAVCHEVHKRIAGSVIQLLSCEDFVNRFIRAIEQGNITGFHSQFRTVDALVIDDIQFLREREQSQEEFFHTYNALYNSGKQIILSADSPPNEIPSIEARLISRFNWGLVARIDPPSYETRVAIVQKKAHLRGLEINDEIAEYIARQVQANIRELEGALTTIYALATTLGEPVDLRLAQTALEGQIKLATKHISITDIIDVVTDHFDVRLTDLQSKRRSQSITVPRQICMYLARNLTRHSLEEIGGHLGGRDHTTVMHACSKIAEAQQSDPQMQALLSELTKRVTQGRQVA